MREGKQAFGARAPRDDGFGPGVSLLGAGVGPGTYSFRHLYGCGEPKASPQMNSSFRSAVPLGQHVRKIDTPGGGDYTPEPDDPSRARSYSALGSSCFAGGSPQHLVNADTTATGTAVGPSSYEQDHHSIHYWAQSRANPRLPAFASSSRRGDPTTW